MCSELIVNVPCLFGAIFVNFKRIEDIDVSFQCLLGASDSLLGSLLMS